MADELWVSQITGYRRRGTRLSEFRDLLGERITVHAILEPLRSCPSYADSEEMRFLLEGRDFDAAGVCDAEGYVIGQVFRSDLTGGRVQSHMRPIGTDSLVSDGATLPEVLLTLKRLPFVYVLIGSRVRGIVSRTDINKPPVRVYLFGIISLLEMHLTFWIRAKYPGNAWRDKLKDKRIQKAEEELSKRRESSISGLAECLQLCDKRDIIVADDSLRAHLGLGSERDAKKMLEKAGKLRDLLAHSQQNISQGSSWEDIISLVEWIEALVRRSDELVEIEAAASSIDFDDGLFAAA